MRTQRRFQRRFFLADNRADEFAQSSAAILSR